MIHTHARISRHVNCIIVGLLALLAIGQSPVHASDIAAGQAAFVRQCALCHTIDKGGPNRFGPNLFGIVGRKAGTVPGFHYSSAFKTVASWDWNETTLGGWISSPRAMVPESPMDIFQGVADRDRDNIVAYLASLK